MVVPPPALFVGIIGAILTFLGHSAGRIVQLILLRSHHRIWRTSATLCRWTNHLDWTPHTGQPLWVWDVFLSVLYVSPQFMMQLSTPPSEAPSDPGASEYSPRTLGVLFAIVSIVVTLGVAEIALRASGFSYRLYPEKIEFGWPNPTAMQDYYQPDQVLLWVPKDYQARLAELRANPPDLIFMGDSCTEFGTYEQYFPLHAAKAGLPEIRAAKLGVGGWSSFQGLQQIRRDVAAIRPKVVTIYFGWNDHWIGFGIQDKEIARLRSPLFTFLEHSRLAQLVTKAMLARGIEGVEVPVRVSPADFRANLEETVRIARAAGITPVLLTAPSSHRVGEEPQYLRKRHLKDLSQLVPLHQQYVDIVRDVASQTNAPLCDLFADFAGLPPQELTKYFNKDGIHLTKGPGDGYDKLAEFLANCFKERGVTWHR